MKRRSLFGTLVALATGAGILPKVAKAEDYPIKELATPIIYRCPDCRVYSLEAYSPYKDTYTCNLCGAEYGGFETETRDHDDRYRYYTGYEPIDISPDDVISVNRAQSPYWRNKA